jgi:hypothetical protein
MTNLETTVLESINHLLRNHANLAPQVEFLAASAQGRPNQMMVGATSKDALATFLTSIHPITGGHPLVRVGGDGDGGYLVPDDFGGVVNCFSPGVAETANFELDMAAKGISSFMADYSVQESPVQHPMLYFEKKYLGIVNDDVFITLDDWVRQRASPEGDLLLQMDIEGAEYRVILDSDRSTLCRFRVIVVEFHAMTNLMNLHGFEIINLAFNKLLKDFEVVHIHPNNCNKPVNHLGFEIPPVMEFTFHRKDRVQKQGFATAFPHALDHTNVAAIADFALPACWHR